MITDDQLAAIAEIFSSGDIHDALSTFIPELPADTSPQSTAVRTRYWMDLRKQSDAKEYWDFLEQESLSMGGVTKAENIADLRADVLAIKEDIKMLRRNISSIPGAAASLASHHATLMKARDLQGKVSGLHAPRVKSIQTDDDSTVKGIKVEWA
jgi:hypothetical protein